MPRGRLITTTISKTVFAVIDRINITLLIAGKHSHHTATSHSHAYSQLLRLAQLVTEQQDMGWQK